MECFSRRFGFRFCQSLGIVSLFFAIPLFAQITYLPPNSGGEVVIGGGGLTDNGSITYVCELGTICQDASFTRSNPGRYTLYDSTPTTGVTTLTVRAGAGQGSTNLVTFLNSAGGSLGGISGHASGIQVFSYELYATTNVRVGSDTSGIDAAGLALRSANEIRWSSTGQWYGSADTGLSRASAGLLKVTDGSTGLGSIMIASQTPASAAAAGAQGTIAWDANYIYVATATNTWKRVAIATWP